MNLHQYLIEQGFNIYDYMSFDNHGEIILSTGFVKGKTFVIVDHLSIFEIDFDYKRYCQKQNEWMKQYDFVYRFVENDLETAKLFLEYQDSDVDYNDMRTYNREASVIDPSPMEYLFEERFADAYGEEAYQYIAREYSIILRNGKTGYIDYALFHEDETFYAIEENGVFYHHPYIIKEVKYKDILMK